MGSNLTGSGVVRKIRVQTCVIHVNRQNVVRVFVFLEDGKNIVEEIGNNLSAIGYYLRGGLHHVFCFAPIDGPWLLIAHEGVECDGGCSEHDQVAGVYH